MTISLCVAVINDWSKRSYTWIFKWELILYLACYIPVAGIYLIRDNVTLGLKVWSFVRFFTCPPFWDILYQDIWKWRIRRVGLTVPLLDGPRIHHFKFLVFSLCVVQIVRYISDGVNFLLSLVIFKWEPSSLEHVIYLFAMFKIAYVLIWVFLTCCSLRSWLAIVKEAHCAPLNMDHFLDDLQCQVERKLSKVPLSLQTLTENGTMVITHKKSVPPIILRVLSSREPLCIALFLFFPQVIVEMVESYMGNFLLLPTTYYQSKINPAPKGEISLLMELVPTMSVTVSRVATERKQVAHPYLFVKRKKRRSEAPVIA